MSALELALKRYGAAGGGVPVVLLHGLFGSSANWHSIAQRLGEGRRALAPDLRNHGRSPRSAEMTYPAMASDVLALLDAQGIDQAVLVGHSMGGKAAMWLALEHPERVAALAVADMAPAAYPHRFDAILNALSAIDLTRIRDRRDADAQLAQDLPSAALRGYLLANLVREADTWRWRIDLPALSAAMAEIVGFPDPGGRQYAGNALFIYGTESDYVTGAHLPVIRTLFPLARLRAVANAGHWVYAEQPEAFLSAVKGLLGD